MTNNKEITRDKIIRTVIFVNSMLIILLYISTQI